MKYRRLTRIFAMSLPVMGGMLSQNLVNLVDAAMVGRLGAAALGAVGLSNVIVFLSSAAMMGLSPAVQAMAARRKGEGNDQQMAFALNGGFILAILVGIPLTIILIPTLQFGLPHLCADPAVAKAGAPYLFWRICSITAIGINFAFRGYWNGISMAKCYMFILSTMNGLNILFNWLFIFGPGPFPELGVAGAGLASCIATWMGSAMYIALGFKIATPHGFARRFPAKQIMPTLLRLAMPSAIQQSFYAGGMTLMYIIVGMVGTIELAATNVITTLYLIGVMPGMGFGLAAASLAGQALGRQDPDDAKQSGWDVVIVASISLAAIAAPLICLPDPIIRLFSPDPALVMTGSLPLQIAGLSLPIQAAGLVLMHALMGAGDNTAVMYISTACQWLFALPAAYLFGPVLGGGLVTIWIIQIIYRALPSVIFAYRWHKAGWIHIKV